MRAISTGMLAMLLIPTSITGMNAPVSMADVTGASSSSAPGVYEVSAWRTHADSLRAEALLPAAQIRRPLERVLGRYNSDPVLVRRISRAVVRESRRQQVPTSLIAAVLLTENTTLRPEATSSVGALGLMQVMPMHAGAQLCQSSDLTDIDSNICHGTLILARDLRRTSTSTAALLRYNGCVRGTNTPDCWRYPSKVLARAGRVRQELLAAAPGTGTLALAVR
jgi:soluble lytic murein transglycosylase-like protein